MSLRAYLEQNNKPGQQVLGTFNSIEGLVRSVLGDSFKETPQLNNQPEPIAENQIPIKPETSLPISNLSKSIDDIIDNAVAQVSIPSTLVTEKLEEPVIEIPKIKVNRKNEYIFHRDIDETFECSLNIEGGSLAESKVRLILKTDSWNLLFEGVIKKNGTCSIPIKKLPILSEGSLGEASLEVIVDDLVFIPWEQTFKIATSKKVSIDNPQIK